MISSKTLKVASAIGVSGIICGAIGLLDSPQLGFLGLVVGLFAGYLVYAFCQLREIRRGEEAAAAAGATIDHYALYHHNRRDMRIFLVDGTAQRIINTLTGRAPVFTKDFYDLDDGMDRCRACRRYDLLVFD